MTIAPTQERLRASEWTARKEEAFDAYITIYARIAAAIQAKHSWAGRWFYFELTAGSGLIDGDAGTIEGSPLLALRAFRRAGLKVDCLFLEHNSAYEEELRRSVEALRSEWTEQECANVYCEIHPNDHRDVLLESERQYGRMGLIYWDGLGQDVYPSLELSSWLRRNPKHDLILMGSGTAPKRMGRARLDRAILTVPRETTWLSDTNGQWQWVFALATDWAPLAARLSTAKNGQPMFAATSPEGRAILDKIGLTRGERSVNRNQLRLDSPYDTFDEYLRHPAFRAVRALAMERANWLCERCGARATEVHHLRYPPWGEFDEVENLLAVCHACHCWIEGKAS